MRWMMAVVVAALLFPTLSRPQTAVPYGTIVALQAPSGRWLSADDHGRLGLTTSAAPGAWEQFQWMGGVNGPSSYMLSFHGTRPLDDMWDSPPVEIATQPFMRTSSFTDRFFFVGAAWYNGVATPNAVAYLNGQILLQSAPNDSARLTLVEGAPGVLSLDQQITCDLTKDAACRASLTFKVVAIATPAQGRAPEKAAVMLGAGFRLQAWDGTWLRSEKVNVWPTNALHSTTVEGMSLRQGGTYGLAYFGKAVEVAGNNYEHGGVLSWGPKAQFIQDYSTNTRWTIVDPYDNTNKRRLGTYTRFCLRAPDGRWLSADPADYTLHLAPNTNSCNPSGTWEHFMLVPQ